MSVPWLRRPILRIALIVGGLTFALSGCHLHHGYVHGGYGYYGGHHGGGHYRGYHKKRHGYHRHRRHGGWRGYY